MGTLLFFDAHTRMSAFLFSTLLSSVTCIWYYPEKDTLESLLQKVPPGTYTRVGILQENSYTDTYQFLDSFGDSILATVETNDPLLNTWTNFSQFLQYLKTIGMTHLDFIECNLGTPPWKYVTDHLTQQLNITISYTSNLLGPEGTWILETDPSTVSDDVALIGLYFNEYIRYYQGNLGTSGGTVDDYHYRGPMHIINNSGVIFSWGHNRFGSFGSGYTQQEQVVWAYVSPTFFSNSPAVSIAGSVNHTMTVLSNGTVFGAGLNVYAQTGTQNGYSWGSNQSAWYNFVQVPGITTAVDVACGDVHSHILLKNGVVMSMGYNYSGQLAINSTASDSVIYNNYSSAIVQSILPEPIKAVYAHYYSSFFLGTSGYLYAAGDNYDGVLGLGTLTNTATAVKITASLFQAASIGYYFSLALDLNGNIWGTGRNQTYQLGRGNTINTNTFQQLTSSTVYASISAGFTHAGAVDTNSRVWLWGDAVWGGLGNGSANTVTVPTMSSMTNVYRIIHTSYRLTILGVLLQGNIRLYSAGLNTGSRLREPYDDQYQSYLFNLTSLGEPILPNQTIQFTFSNTPTLSSVTPTYGTTNTPLLVTGTNLNAITNASFGSKSANISTNSSTSIVLYTPSGTGNVSVSMNDANGNVLTMPGNFTYQNPTVTTLSPLTGTTNTLLSIAGSNLTNTSFIKLQGYNTSFTINSSVLLTASVNASSGNASVVVVDNLGNNASYSGNFTYQNPTVTTFTPTFGTKNTSVSLTGFNLSNTSYVLFGNASASINLVTGTNVNVNVPANTGNVSVSVRDNLGNIVSAPGNFTYQNPTITSLSPLTGTTNTLLSIAGSNLTNTSFIKLQGYNTSFTVNSSVLLTASVNASSGNASVVVVDNLGNNASYSGNFTYQNPTVTTISPLFGSKNTTLNVTGTNLANTSVVKIGGYASSFTIVSPTSINVTTPNTSGNVSVVLVDTVGNNTSYTGNFTYRNLTVSSVNPLFGTKNTPVTITGSNLNNTSYVVFGTINASIQSVTATAVNVSAPSNTGNVSVYLVDNDGNSIYHENNFVYQNPSISAISPFNGTKNTIVSLSGSNLTNTSFVQIRGVNTSFTINSSVLLNASVPANTNGVATVVAIDNLGNNTPYSGFFTYTNPTVVSMNTSGAPNSTMVINGTNLANTSVVNFNNTSAKFTALSDSINVSVPFAYGNVSVTVIDTAGNSYPVPGSFLYKTPGLTGMVPETAPSNTTISLYGMNLVNTSYITFGTVRSTTFTATSNTINVSVPVNNGNVSVIVTDIYGNNTYFARNFLFINTFISDINPSVSFPKTNVTLTGGYFTNTSMVYFGETPTSFVIQSDSIVNASVPSSSGNTSISTQDNLGYITYYKGNFTYKNMIIDAFTPLTNVKNSTIVINGKELSNVVSATVGSSPATVKIISNYQLQLTVPTPTGNGKINLTDSYGNTVTSTQTFTTKVPTVTGLDKSSAKIGDTLTINGTDLSYMKYVVFGSERATQNVVITDSQIVCTIPYGIGTISLQISDNYMNSIVLSSAFTYILDVPVQILVLVNRPTFTIKDETNNIYSSSGTTITKNNTVFYTDTFPISGIAIHGNILYICQYSNNKVVQYNMDTQTKTFLTILSSDNVQPNILKVYGQFLYVICTANPSTTNPDYFYTFDLSANTYQRKALLPEYTFQGFTKGQTKVSGVYVDCFYFSAVTRNTTNGRICIADLTGTITNETFIPSISNPIDLLYLNGNLYIDGSTVILVNVNSPSTALATYQSSPSSQYNSVFYGTTASGNVIYMINTTTNAIETVPAPSVLSSDILANSLSPTSGTQNTHVVITGQNFLASDYTPQIKGVLFQSVAATNFTIVSSTLVYCDAPAGGGNASIQLVDMSNNPINTSLMFVYQTPRILDNYPKRSIVDDYMYIYGLNMNLVTSVLIGTVSATFVLIRVDYLRVQIPNGSGINQSISLIDQLNNVIINPAFTFSYYVYNSTICFPANTLVKCDQGNVPIQKLMAGKDTLHGKEIVAITETYSMDPHLVCIEKDALRKNCPQMQTFISPRHKIYDNGKMKAAFRLVGRKGVSFVPYTGEKLYNVLLKEHALMNVQGLICETLHPSNPVVKHYLQNHLQKLMSLQ